MVVSPCCCCVRATTNGAKLGGSMGLKKIAGLVAAGALTASLGLASPASAQNYAPGLPEPEPGLPNNPPAAAPIIPTVTLEAQNVAADAPPRVMRQAPGNRIGEAPRVRARTNRPIALVVTGETASSWSNVPGLTPGSRYLVLIKQPGEEYGTLGTVVGSPFAALPVFEASRPGLLIVALQDVRTLETFYIKVRVR